MNGSVAAKRRPFWPVNRRLPEDKEVSGLGGWMIIPIIGLLFEVWSVLVNIQHILAEIIVFFWNLSPVAYGVMRSLHLFLLLFLIYVFLSAVISLWLLFRRSRYLRVSITLHYAFFLSMTIFVARCDTILSGACGTYGIDHMDSVRIGAAIYCVFWAAYFNRSRRAKNTFVR